MPAPPFAIHFLPQDVAELRDRVRRTRWAPELDGAGWRLGVPSAELQRLAARWLDGFDFEGYEARLNQLPHYRADVAGQSIHFIHRRGRGPAPLPLVLTHGWPWTFWDF